MKTIHRFLALAATFVAFVNPCEAALVDAGNGLVNDTTQNLTWVKDGNLWLTLANESGSASGFATLVASRSGGWATVGDYGPQNGMMDWFAGQGFAYYLNSINYKGFSNWRMPTTVNSFASLGYPDGNPGNPTTSSSELAHLFYVDLGQVAGASLGVNPGPFVNVQAAGGNDWYWSSPLMPYNAFLFSPASGLQWNSFSMNGIAFVWPVRDGLAPVVPTVAQRIASLISLVSTVRESRGMVAKLKLSQTYYSVPDVPATCAVLAAFVRNFREEVRGPRVADLRAQVLADTQLLQSAVGCK